METKYYDIGLNLFTRSFPDPEKIIRNAEEAGVRCILTGSEARENELVADFVKNHDVWGTAGIHPHSADTAKEEDVERVRELVMTNPKIVAVGETGLDYDHMYSKKENQIHFFKELLDVAEETGKPLFLHERDAADDFIACFKGHEDLCRRAIVHCYTGDKKTLERFIDMGFYDRDGCAVPHTEGLPPAKDERAAEHYLRGRNACQVHAGAPRSASRSSEKEHRRLLPHQELRVSKKTLKFHMRHY